MIFIYTILVISLLFNFLVVRYDFIPFYYPKIINKIFPKKSLNRDLADLKELLLKASIEAVSNEKSIMVWKDHIGVAELLIVKRDLRSNKEFQNINFPRSFMFQGISQYLKMFDLKPEKDYVKKYFDKLVDSSGQPRFKLDMVDQVPLGVVSLNFYQMYKEDKYLIFADYIFKFLLDNSNNRNSQILYRPNQEMVFYDTIGMVVPFLVKYFKVTGNNQSLSLAKSQLQFYVHNGLSGDTFIPSHAIHMDLKIRLGSSNWGRGIGWYFLGLKELFELDGSFEKEYYGLSNTLMKLKNKEGLWSQFPGSSDTFDSSTTLMFLYCLPKEMHTIDDILSLMDKYISKDGYVLQCSGDTYDLNSYSKTFGKSELSQGMMLLLLERYK